MTRAAFPQVEGSAIYRGHVAHLRLRPRRHALRYRVFMLLLDLDELDAVAARLRSFRLGRFGLVSFRARDHGDGSTTPLRAQVGARLAQAGLTFELGTIRLLCLPRILGYAFNPLSVYFCQRRDGAPGAILYEVSSTFGERHSYLVASEPDARGVVRQSADKRLHVSPFMDMALRYGFRVRPPTPLDGSPLTLTVDAADADGPIFYAGFAGRRHPLTDGALLAAWLSHPLVTVKVIVAIHWEAVKLMFKGLRLRDGPAAPTDPVSLGVCARPSSVDAARAPSTLFEGPPPPRCGGGSRAT